jgi:hypothetical protein
MKKSQLNTLIQYIHEIAATSRDYTVISRLQHDLWVSAEPDTPLRSKSEVDYETEYLKLYKHLDRIRAALGIAPYPDGGLNPFEVCETLVGLMSRIAELQRAATVNVPTHPSDGRPWGIDYNGLVHLIKSLVKS